MSELVTLSNLYPRPDQTTRGMFNAQLFEALAERLRAGASPGGPGSGPLQNVCPVPEWRVWRWPAIRAWQSPRGGAVETRYVPVFYVPRIGRDWSWRTYGWSLDEAMRSVRDLGRVFSTWLYPDGVAAVRLASRRGCPAWIMVQGSDTVHLDHPLRRRAILEACASAQGLVCVCRSLADRVVAAGVDKGRVHIAPNGVDAGKFRYRPPADARGQLGRIGAWPPAAGKGRCLPDARIALFVGHLVPVKGVDVLFEAWKILLAGRTRGADAPQLVLVGDGPLRGALERQAERLGIRHEVTFAGVRSHDEVALWMNAAECLCLSSRSEGMPNAVIEALCCGLPVVSSDVGACRELLDGDPGCRTVPPGDAGALASALADALGAEDCGRQARSVRNAGRFSWGRQADTILNLMGMTPL